MHIEKIYLNGLESCAISMSESRARCLRFLVSLLGGGDDKFALPASGIRLMPTGVDVNTVIKSNANFYLNDLL